MIFGVLFLGVKHETWLKTKDKNDYICGHINLLFCLCQQLQVMHIRKNNEEQPGQQRNAVNFFYHQQTNNKHDVS